MRIALAILMALHGIAHTPGFATSWKLAPAGGIPYKTTVFGGRLDLGDTGIRAIGILWLIAAFAFLIGAVATVMDTSWWRSIALVAALASLALSLLELPLARIGVFINLFILVMVWAL
jgi:hypothetical protein